MDKESALRQTTCRKNKNKKRKKELDLQDEMIRRQARDGPSQPKTGRVTRIRRVRTSAKGARKRHLLQTSSLAAPHARNMPRLQVTIAVHGATAAASDTSKTGGWPIGPCRQTDRFGLCPHQVSLSARPPASAEP